MSKCLSKIAEISETHYHQLYQTRKRQMTEQPYKSRGNVERNLWYAANYDEVSDILEHGFNNSFCRRGRLKIICLLNFKCSYISTCIVKIASNLWKENKQKINIQSHTRFRNTLTICRVRNSKIFCHAFYFYMAKSFGLKHNHKRSNIINSCISDWVFCRFHVILLVWMKL